MKTQQIKDLHAKSAAELNQLHREKQKRLQSLRFDLAAGKVKNVAEIRALRKDIARILTIIRANHGQ